MKYDIRINMFRKILRFFIALIRYYEKKRGHKYVPPISAHTEYINPREIEWMVRTIYLCSGKTQREIAKVMGVTQSAFQTWANGKNFPTYKNLVKLLEFTMQRMKGVKITNLKKITPVHLTYRRQDGLCKTL